MKRLIWKELMESRYIPLASASLVATVIIVWTVVSRYVASHGGDPYSQLTVENASVSLWGGIVACAIFSGSSVIASEAGNGTLAFLSTLPVSRARVWWGKVLGSLILGGSSLVLMSTLFALVLVCLFGRSGWTYLTQGSLGQDIWSQGFAATGPVLFLYFLGSAILFSALTDRPLAAAGLALLFGGVLPFIVGTALNVYAVDDTLRWVIRLTMYAVPGIWLTSFLVFRGNSIVLSKRRFLVAAVSLCLWFGVPAAVYGAYLGVVNYVQSLAGQGVPIPADYQAVPQRVGNEWHWVKYRQVSITYGRVSSGTTYTGDTMFMSDRLLAEDPVTSRDNNADVHSQIMQEQFGKRKVFWVHYVYTPTGNLGWQHQEIDVLGKDGKVIGRVKITARKAFGLFFPPNWFTTNASQTASRTNIGSM